MDTIIGRNFGVSFVELCRQPELYWPIVSWNTIREARFVLGRYEVEIMFRAYFRGIQQPAGKNRIIKLVMMGDIIYLDLYCGSVPHSVIFISLAISLKPPNAQNFYCLEEEKYLMFSL